LPKVFTREATGLVREASWFDAFTYTATGMGFQFSFYFAASLAPLIGGNIYLALALFAVPIILVPLGYSILIHLMPRSGGDYVFNSRVLHPLIGFVANIVAVVAILLFAAINSVTIETTGFSTLFAYLGVTYSNPIFVNLASKIGSLPWLFTIGLVWMLLGVAVSIFSIKIYFRIQNILFVVVLLGIASTLAALLMTTHSGFVSSFNAFTSKYTGTQKDYYTGIVQVAQKSGWHAPSQTSILGTLLLLPVFATMGFNINPSYIAGEIRRAGRSSLIGSLLGSAFWFTGLAAGLILAYHVMGFPFLSATDYMLFNNPSQVPLPALPYVDMLLATSTPPALSIIIILAGVIQLFIYIPWAYITMSRALFAYSIDGLLPEKISDTSDRTHGPVKATIISAIIALVLYIVINIPQSATYAYLLGSIGLFLETLPVLFIGVSLILLPLKPELCSNSWVKPPVLTIIGLAIVSYMALLEYLYMTQSVYGANTPLAIGLAATLLVLFSGVYLLQRFRKPNLQLAFKEIPPE
jgi:APA family basic amino acid/polyamine antiporter